MNNNHRVENNQCCYFHPRERVVGICALCLRERLLSLVLKQGYAPISKYSSNKGFKVLRTRASITLPKVFAFGSFLHRLEPSRRNRDKQDQISDKESIASLEESFISIKFEDNGQASWESKKKNDIAAESKSKGAEKTMIEHVKPEGAMRWRKRIGQLLQTARWKRSNKAGTGQAANVSNVTGMSGRKGWIRSLTRRRSTEK